MLPRPVRRRRRAWMLPSLVPPPPPAELLPNSVPLVVDAAPEDAVAEQGWQVYRGKRRPLKEPSSAHGEGHGNRLAFKERLHGRCFRCLAHDHLVSACRDPVRCLACLCSGHRQRDCRRRRPACPDSRRPSSPGHLLPRSWASVVALAVMPENHAPAVVVETAASAGMTTMVEDKLKFLFAALVELLRVELHRMASVLLKEAVHPLHDSMQSWIVQMGNLLEQTEVAVGRLTPVLAGQVENAPGTAAPLTPPTLPGPLKELPINFTDEGFCRICQPHRRHCCPGDALCGVGARSEPMLPRAWGSDCSGCCTASMRCAHPSRGVAKPALGGAASGESADFLP